MKTRLNIFCILLLITFGGLMYHSIMNGIAGGSDAARGDLNHSLKPLYYVNLVPTEENKLQDSIPSILQKGDFLKYHLTSIKVERETLPKYEIITMCLMLLSFPIIFMVPVSLYLFVRLILSIYKKDLFNLKNVFRVRFISATILAGSLFKLISTYLNHSIATQSICIPGYEVGSVIVPWGMFITALLLATFAEIYAQAIKLKEEQDLTI